jgi:hypothetical protein
VADILDGLQEEQGSQTTHGYHITVRVKLHQEAKDKWVIVVWFGADKLYEVAKRFGTYSEAHDMSRSLIEHHRKQVKALIRDLHATMNGVRTIR